MRQLSLTSRLSRREIGWQCGESRSFVCRRVLANQLQERRGKTIYVDESQGSPFRYVSFLLSFWRALPRSEPSSAAGGGEECSIAKHTCGQCILTRGFQVRRLGDMQDLSRRSIQAD